MARPLLAYFLRYPGTADSHAGIARWRLLDASYTHETSLQGCALHIEEALAWLLDQGYLSEESVPGGGRVVVLDTTDLRRARRFVASGSSL